MSLSVVSVGARTPFGLDARSSALCFRAGLIPLRGNPLAGRDGAPVFGGFLPTLAWDVGAPARALELAVAAAREALLALPERRPAPSVAVVAATSSGGAAAAADRLRAELGLGGSARVEVTDEGDGSAADLLPRVQQLLGGHEADVVLWGGLHSDAGSDVIRELVETDRLYDGEHLDAVLPGEAAAFVALARPGTFGKELAQLVGWGAATTEARPDNDEPIDGAALAEAVRSATREPAGWVLFDAGYEALRLREWEMVQVRARASLGDPYLWDALPQRMGRPGAATLPLSGALVAASAAVGHVPAARVLGMAGTDAGRRAAVVWQVG